MGALDGTAADVEIRSQPAINAEMRAPHGRADDIDDGVDGADFVEVNLLDGHGVNLGFGFTEQLKREAGT